MEYFGPGPFNTSLLTLQEKHISTSIWDGEETLFRARYNLWQTLPSEQVLQVIRNTAFANLLNIGGAEINNHLLTAMVERWRPETHTFHFPNGECTITLEDVAYQLGIPIDGKAVTGDTSLDWGDLCQ
ncbi:PREDICTED: serine/threonine-protein phosphatase 7 long form homolog [Lupinus angustifolius]|uniref:serine/threonine-protein phosphatase 7 long form homolog n=1 Tax=Lupinus angustifolius TaxID=3871 RepID=UPI00092F90C9|nr:PREDICTED: serine/threonine-protein phosphatase 7 long form homolog [Lupinus angustifolius]